MSLGDRIRFLRKARGLTQEELTAKAKLGRNAVSRYENDSVDIPGRALVAICDALEVDPMELMDSEDPILFTVVDKFCYMPERAHEADAGFDLFSPKHDLLPAKGSTVIDTGVHIQIPKGYAGVIISKSGLNIKHGIISDGLIDSGYTGSIRVKLYNLSNTSYEIRPGDKISQIMFIQIASPRMIQTDRLCRTERGDNGFGSTGR